MTAHIKLDAYIARAKIKVQNTVDLRYKFLDTFRSDPYKALHWSESMFAAQAEDRVIEQILFSANWHNSPETVRHELEGKDPWPVFVDWIRTRAIEAGSAGGSQSTLVTGNLMDLYTRRAWCEAARNVEFPAMW